MENINKIKEIAPFRGPSNKVREYAESLPLVIFTRIHAITSNSVTRNYTYYPTESLIGNSENGTGVTSFSYHSSRNVWGPRL